MATLLLTLTGAGCAAAPVAMNADPGRAIPAAVAPSGQRIVLTLDGHVVSATLTDTVAGRDFALLLPLTLDLRDPFGQAKSGQLPAVISFGGADPVLDPDAGGIYYVPDSATFAVFYDDLGQTVPPPGLIHLGSVDGDLATIASAGNRIRARIELADRASY